MTLFETIDDTDARIVYSTDPPWMPGTGSGRTLHSPKAAGAQVDLPFEAAKGAEIHVIGMLQKSSLGPTVAFSVDGCTPSFQETQLNSSAVNNVFFRCVLDNSGNHTLRIVIVDRPFSLDAIELHGPTDSPGTLPVSSSEYAQKTPTPDATVTDMRAKTVDAGAILGGINLVLVILLTLAALRLKRKVERLHSRIMAGTLPQPVTSNGVAARPLMRRIACPVVLEDDQSSDSSKTSTVEPVVPRHSDNVVELSSNAATHGTRVRTVATQLPRSDMGSDAATLATYCTRTTKAFPKVDRKCLGSTQTPK